MTKNLVHSKNIVGNKIVETIVRELPMYRVEKVKAEWWWTDKVSMHSLFIDGYVRMMEPKLIKLTTMWASSMDDFKDGVHKESSKAFDFYYVVKVGTGSDARFVLKENVDGIEKKEFMSMVGYMAFPKGLTKRDKLSIECCLTDVYQQSIYSYNVYSNMNDELVESYEQWENDTTIGQWMDIVNHAKSKYGVNIVNAKECQ